MMHNDTIDKTKKSLHPTPFIELPLGSILAEGWLKDQLRIQAEGFTGLLPDHWYDLGPHSGWLGGEGEAWERGPYYLDGLLPLAYVLEDDELINKTTQWIEWTLNSQQEDGQFGPASNNDWWSRMVMTKVLAQYTEATGDKRVEPFLLNYFRYMNEHIDERPLSDWGQARGGENIYVLQWLYDRTGESFLLDLAVKTHEQTLDWTGIFNNFPYWRTISQFDHRTHVVNVAMALKEPALYALISGESQHSDAPKNGIDQLMRYHGQLHGMFSGDEWLAGTHPSQGVELCAVVEYMYTLEQLVRIYGEGQYGDILEQVSYNALPAMISADWTSRQYVHQVNQIQCTHDHRNWTENKDDANMFGLEPNFGCCTANMHQGWPKLTSHLWMGTVDGGLAAISYAPCRVRTNVLSSVQLELNVRTNYPFKDTIVIEINPSEAAVFPLKLRIPSWCTNASVLLNREKLPFTVSQGYASFEREWQQGDVLQVTFPMKVRVEKRANHAVGVLRGPLVYGLPLKENWVKRSGNPPFLNWELLLDPQTPWNYGLSIDPDHPESAFQVEECSLPRQPFQVGSAPVRLRTKARRIPEWNVQVNSAGELPLSPAAGEGPLETIELVPYAAAKLRVAEFPVVKEART